MLAKVFSAAIVDLDAQIIEVEVETSYGLRSFNIVGLPDKAVQEAKERVGAAIESSGFQSPHHQPIRVLVSLAPADLKKEGSLYDLPIALGCLLAEGKIKFEQKDKIFLGELALDGRLRPIKGAISFALTCKRKKISEIILPKENAPEAGLIKGIKVIGAENLREIIDYLEKRKEITPFKTDISKFSEAEKYPLDLGYIKGQESQKRALEITAAGGHHLLMVGPPGTGKSLLAKAIPSILPPLSFEESLEVTKIYSNVGLLKEKEPLIRLRPFRSPHHTISEVALIGGGNPPRPGEITLTHRGVLFLDEFPEFHRDVLESLRQPIEEGKITISRSKHSITLPARFTLVAASNPCPCGYYGDPERKCTCTNSQVQMYGRKLSGPLIDRIDIFINVPQIKYEKLIAVDEENCSEKVRERVKKARRIQKERFAYSAELLRSESEASRRDLVSSSKTNSEMEIPEIKKYCQIAASAESLLKKAVNSDYLSPRGYHRVLKVARTIADLDGSEKILLEHLSEALSYRFREEIQ